MSINVTSISEISRENSLVPISTKYHDTDLWVVIRIVFNRFGTEWYPDGIQGVLHEIESK